MSAPDAAEVIVDARGMRCPWPALRLAKAMKDADTVRLLADDPKAPGEIVSLSRSKGWSVIEITEGFIVRQSSNVTMR